MYITYYNLCVVTRIRRIKSTENPFDEKKHKKKIEGKINGFIVCQVRVRLFRNTLISFLSASWVMIMTDVSNYYLSGEKTKKNAIVSSFVMIS